MHSYENRSTIVTIESNEIEFQMAYGAKQGDPLSPYLFNMVMGEFIRELECGITLSNNVKVAILDDLLLFSESV